MQVQRVIGAGSRVSPADKNVDHAVAQQRWSNIADKRPPEHTESLVESPMYLLSIWPLNHRSRRWSVESSDDALIEVRTVAFASGRIDPPQMRDGRPVTDLTIVIPTFNKADNVDLLVCQLNKELARIDAEVLFVVDSTDVTPLLIARAGARSRLPARLVHGAFPMGQLAGAVMTGLLNATSSWVVVMDGDLQHPPSVVPHLYRQALLAHGDIVVASRYIEGATAGGLSSRFRRLVSTWSGRAAKGLFPRRLSGCTDPMSGFFAVRRDAIAMGAVKRSRYKVLLALPVHQQLRVTEVPFTFADRHPGYSKTSIKEGLRYAWLLIILRWPTPPRILEKRTDGENVPPTAAEPSEIF
jgi:hypothetical protein